MKKLLILIITGFLFVQQASAQNELIHYSFDQTPADRISKGSVDTVRYKSGFFYVRSENGWGVRSNSAKSSIVLLNVLPKYNVEFALEFDFKGGSFSYSSLANTNFRIIYQYDQLVVQFNTVKGTQTNANRFDFPLRFSAPESYNYLSDGNWHNFYLYVNVKTGKLIVYLDGQTSPRLTKDFKPADKIFSTTADGFNQFEYIDEFKVLSGNKYKQQFGRAAARVALETHEVKDFAPGYPDYNMQVVDQLRSFPSPRLKNGEMVKRNFNWIDISYLYRQWPSAGGKRAGIEMPQNAVDIMLEMHDFWNYYYEIPVFRTDSVDANKRYSSKGYANALIAAARKRDDIKTSAVLFQIQSKPVHAGFESNIAFARSQNLPDKYYLRDKNGKVIIHEKKKWISPLAPLDFVQKDAYTNAFYLRQMEKYLGRPINFLNDNGEIFLHMRPESLLKRDPEVYRQMEKMKLNNKQYNGYFQNLLDTAYKNTLLRSLNWKHTAFSFYNVSAYNDNYWPGYDMRRTTNSSFDNIHYSTPAFYPATPENWRRTAGPLNGYSALAFGRKTEIKMGDKLFSPFVAAGWNLEEKNIRPAQWLGLLKAMTMLGAEFYYTSYFNVSGSKGWPNGVGPNDPRGYAYQIAMPVYAQGVFSYLKDFLVKSVLLDPQSNLSEYYSYRFKASSESHLVMVRKLDKKYLIYGTVQPNSNYKNNTPENVITSIELDGQEFILSLRKQGSFYWIDLTDKNKPIALYIDQWHESTHPSYWTRNTLMEAELCDTEGNVEVMTDFKYSYNDLTDFRSYLRANAGAIIRFSDFNRNKIGSITVLIKGKGALQLKLPGGKSIHKEINTSEWSTIEIKDRDLSNLRYQDVINIEIVSGTLNVDQITLIP